MHVVHHLMAHFYAFPCLLKSILVSMNLRYNCTILQLKLTYYKYLTHSIGNALLFQIDKRQWQVIEGMLNALGTFLKHL